MEFGLVGPIDLWYMEVLTTTSTDPDTIAAVDMFNAFFSLTFEFGILSFVCTMIFLALARS
jgi:hypothetical protein